MNIYIGEPVEVSDMQWPCPDGFHVPSSDEWYAIDNAGISLWAWKWYTPVDFSTYLKIPMAGYREFNNTVYEIGSEGQYWSSSAHASYESYAYFLIFRESDVNPTAYTNRARGVFVRCVKNSPTIPTESWTVLYQWTWDAWIFHNATDWLISISSDGSTWYTLMDKNLGATTVYNYWDTLSVANTGNIFQWWNNYPFPSTLSSDSITTSSTQVNATWYWPWNYYSSSTYITWNGNWSYVNNKNLRWWVSQGTSTNSVEVQNIYIGKYKSRLPSAYQEVEYIQLTWTQRISPLRLPVNFRFTIKASFDTTSTYYNIYDTQSSSPMLWVDTSWRFEMNKDYKSSVFTKNTFLTVVSDSTWSNSLLSIDWTQVIQASKITSITYDTTLLHRGSSDWFKWKISSIVIEDWTTQIRDYVPCYRKSDNVIWMYDLVNNQFYTNSWSWTFTKWPDVN